MVVKACVGAIFVTGSATVYRRRRQEGDQLHCARCNISRAHGGKHERGEDTTGAHCHLHHITIRKVAVFVALGVFYDEEKSIITPRVECGRYRFPKLLNV
jgi:hypothetical protein